VNPGDRASISARRALRQARAPDEQGAQQRAWTVIRSAYDQRSAPVVHRSRWRLAVVPVLVLVAGALALSPAGATVSRLIQRALGVPHAAPALFSLPTPGRLLLSGPGGTRIVSADGSSRRLGSWRQASWSPHGLYVAVASADQLAAVDTRGVIHWTLARPAVSDPRWYSPTGFRIAYLSGHQLRVVAGDGTSDHLLAAHVAPVAPAWRAGHPYQLAYTTGDRTLVVRDAGSGRVMWTSHPGAVTALAWAGDGNRLLALSRTRATVYGPTGRVIATIRLPAGAPALDGSLSPDGRKLALVRGGFAQDVVLTRLGASRPRLRRVLSGDGLRQVAWSPDGRWLLVSWPAADQWVFARVAGTPRIAAVSRITQQFAGSSSGRAFPRLEGWCCTARGGAG
jgi:hypothetical protein